MGFALIGETMVSIHESSRKFCSPKRSFVFQTLRLERNHCKESQRGLGRWEHLVEDPGRGKAFQCREEAEQRPRGDTETHCGGVWFIVTEMRDKKTLQSLVLRLSCDSFSFHGRKVTENRIPHLQGHHDTRELSLWICQDCFRVEVGASGTCQAGIPPHFPLHGEGDPAGENNPHLI